MAKLKKKQQGFQLPDDVITWLDEEEGGTGVSLSRLALAAFCTYMLEDDRHQHFAMATAMAVERGEWSFRELRREWLNYRLRLATEGLAKMPKDPEMKKHRDATAKMIEGIRGELVDLQMGIYKREAWC